MIAATTREPAAMLVAVPQQLIHRHRHRHPQKSRTKAILLQIALLRLARPAIAT